MFWRPGTKGERHGLEKDVQNYRFLPIATSAEEGEAEKRWKSLLFLRPGQGREFEVAKNDTDPYVFAALCRRGPKNR